MKKTLHIFLLLFAFIALPTITKGQVTIGKDIPPKTYSLLQIEYDETQYPNGAGVLLPKVDMSERTKMMNKVLNDDNAIGLTIYNTTTHKVEYWNGDEWIEIPGFVEPTFEAQNGLHYTTGEKSETVSLGGSLTKPTDIALNGHTFTIEQEENTQLKIGPLTVKNDKTGIGVTTGDPTARLHINRTAPENGLRISDGSEGTNKVLTAIDEDGYAHWKNLDPVVEVSKGRTVGAGTTIGYSTTNITYTKISSVDVTCTPGKWLIIGRFMSYDSTKESNYYSWAKLQTSTNQILAIAGAKTEPGGTRWSMPQVVYYGVFTQNTTIGLYAAAPGSTSKLDTQGGETIGGVKYPGFIYAIKLAK